MEATAQQGGTRQTRAVFIAVHFDGVATVTKGFAKGGKLTRTGVGAYDFEPDPQPLTLGPGVSFSQGTCDKDRTSVQIIPRNALPPAAFQQQLGTWNAAGTKFSFTTEQNAVAADYDFDLIVTESERSGQTGAG